MMMFSVLLGLGCPEPVDFSDRTVDNSTVQANSQDEAPSFQAANNTAMPTDAANSENSEGAPPSMGTFAADLPESEVQPRFTQEELVDGATFGTRITSATGRPKCSSRRGDATDYPSSH
jgi:hypothetical protein